MGDIDIDDLLHDLHDVTAPTPQKPAFSNNYPGNNSNTFYDSSYNSASPSIFPHPPQQPNPGQNPKSRFVRSDGSTSQKTSPVYKTSSTTNNKNSELQKEVDQNLDDWLDSLTISSSTNNANVTAASSTFNVSNALPPSPTQKTNVASSFATTSFSPDIAKSNQSVYQQFGLSTSLAQTTDVHNRSFAQTKSNKTNPPSASSSSSATTTIKKKIHHSHTDDLENSWDEEEDAFNSSNNSNDFSNHNGSFSLASLSNTTFSRKTSMNNVNNTNNNNNNNNIVNNNSASSKVSSSSSSSSANSGGSQKLRCCQVVLGTASTSRGHRPSSFSPCVCDALLCSQCNFKVLFFPHKKWAATADYLFFRNNMPNTEKLAAKLEKDDGGGAYCCQCKSANVSATDEKRVLSIGNPQDPQWICMGHVST